MYSNQKYEGEYKSQGARVVDSLDVGVVSRRLCPAGCNDMDLGESCDPGVCAHFWFLSDASVPTAP